MKFYIQCRGDWSVGIPGCQTVLDWPELQEDPNDSENKEYILFVKEELKESFSKIFDDKSTVVFTEKEFEKFTKEDPYQEER